MNKFEMEKPGQTAGAPEGETLGVTVAANAMKPAASASQIMRYCLRGAGVRILDLESFAQNALTDMLVTAFDPDKADKLFLDMGEQTGPLLDMQQCVGFRSMVYRLAEKYPDCLWAKHSLRRMSKAGYKDEVNSFLTAAHEAKEFMAVLNSATSERFNLNAIGELARVLCRKPYTYVYSMVLIQELSLNSELGKMMMQATRNMAIYYRDNNTFRKTAKDAFAHAIAHPEAYKPFMSIVARNKLNLSDVVELHSCCTSLKPAPDADFMRDSPLMDLLIDSLFRVDVEQNGRLKNFSLNINLLGYVGGKPAERKELMVLIAKIHTICKEWPKQQENERARSVETISSIIQHPVIGACVLRWIEDLVAEPHYFSRCSPVEHFMNLVDRLSANHSILHGRILHMLIRLFEGFRNKEDSKIMKIIIFDRLMVLLGEGYVQADRYINLCFTRGDVSR